MKKLYNEERDTDGYDNIVMKHLLAMTTEELHGKVTIAVELAYRDWQIEQLREALKGMMDAYSDLCDESEPNYRSFKCRKEKWDDARKALEETK